MKFKLGDAFQFGWEGLKGWAFNFKEDFPNTSAAYIEVTGSHGKIKNVKSDRIYYVLEGKGQFIINDKTMPVERTDVIIVPKNTPYDYSGNMKLFLVHAPAFDERNDVKL